MPNFESPAAPPETNPELSEETDHLSRKEKNLQKKRGDFEQHIEKRAQELGITPEEYLATYAHHQKELYESNRLNSPAKKKLFQLGTASGDTINQSIHEQSSLEVHSTIEPLTKLLNRRGFEIEVQKLQSHIQRLENLQNASPERREDKRREKPKYYSIMFIDADKFKNINTQYGHDIGDVVLKKIADILKTNIRDGEGIVARWGGEELIGLVPVDIDTACVIAERIREAIEQTTFEIKKNAGEQKETFKVTISIGIAPYDKDIAKQIKAADMAVQAAKGDFGSVEKLANELGEISIESDRAGETRNQIQFVKAGVLSKYSPKPAEQRDQD